MAPVDAGQQVEYVRMGSRRDTNPPRPHEQARGATRMKLVTPRTAAPPDGVEGVDARVNNNIKYYYYYVYQKQMYTRGMCTDKGPSQTRNSLKVKPQRGPKTQTPYGGGRARRTSMPPKVGPPKAGKGPARPPRRGKTHAPTRPPKASSPSSMA